MTELLADLEGAILANLKARQIACALASRPEGSDRPLSASEATEALFGQAYKSQPGYPTMRECREAHLAVCGRFGGVEGLILLQRYACDCVEALFMGLYPRFLAFANATLTHNVPPSASWEGHGDDLRPSYPKLFNKDDDL